MSAFDITGAVIWTPLAVLSWRLAFAWEREQRPDADLAFSALAAFASTAGSVFSLARILGAHL